MKEIFQEVNPILDSEYNPYFEQAVYMSETEWDQWVKGLRVYIKDQMEHNDWQPLVYRTREEIIDEFKTLDAIPVEGYEDGEDEFGNKTHVPINFIVKDELSGSEDVLRDFRRPVPGLRQFFPGMAKTSFAKFHSTWEYVTEDKLERPFHLTINRNLKRDGFFIFSDIACVNDSEGSVFDAGTGLGWLIQFNDAKENPKVLDLDYRLLGKKRKTLDNLDFWIFGDYKDANYTFRGNDVLTLDREDLHTAYDNGWIHKRHMHNLRANTTSDKATDRFLIRIFHYGKKLFPACFKTFQTGLGANPTGFPEVRCKWLFNEFTKQLNQDKVIIYDSSAGWGNRLVATLALNGEKEYHYVGTDPNTANLIRGVPTATDVLRPDNRSTSNGNGADIYDVKSRYEYFARFYNDHVRDTWMGDEANSFTIFQDGSEDIHRNKEFQKFKGLVDLYFTSPPYFDREQYSTDDTQSYKKFNSYESWVEGFLRPTIETAYEWLRHERFLIFNIANIRIGKDKFWHLEEDTFKILDSLGLEYVCQYKMLLNVMAGAYTAPEKLATNDDGIYKDTKENVCMVNGRHFKFEPIFVFYKP